MYGIIAIFNTVGPPDIFITMTGNLYWPEIQNALFANKRADDKPDL